MTLKILERDKAEAIVREVAQNTQAKSVLKKLGKIDPQHIANARASFAQTLNDNETPLTLVDRSFLQNGKAGMLLTNSRLYSSTGNQAIPMSDIMAVSVEKPTSLQVFVAVMLGVLYLLFRRGRPLRPKLLVNGNVVFEGTMNEKFWTEVLTRLSYASRDRKPRQS